VAVADGTLLQGRDGTVYIVQAGRRRLVPTRSGPAALTLGGWRSSLTGIWRRCLWECRWPGPSVPRSTWTPTWG
jgi:hypothetical protein